MSDEERQAASNPLRNCCMCLIATGVMLVLALVLVLVPMSFKSLQYYELGFPRRSSTGVVDASKAYGGGLHFIGPDYKFKIFKADAHFVKFRRVRVFTLDRLQVSITAQMQYFLRKEQLPMLHEEFDINYETILENNALDAIKGAATVFSVREFIRSRGQVEKALLKAVRERLGGVCCEKDCQTSQCEPGCKPNDQCLQADAGLFAEVRYLQLHGLDIPSGLDSRYIESLLLQESTVTAKLQQGALIERKTTDALVMRSENEAREVRENATSRSELIRSRAKAEAEALIEQARSEGLKYLFDQLGLRSTEQRLAFDYLRTLRVQKQASLGIDYQTYVAMAGPTSKIEY